MIRGTQFDTLLSAADYCTFELKPITKPFPHSLKSDPGTYGLILKSISNKIRQVGRWGQLNLQPGYYIYIGSAFGLGGVKARVSRHLRVDKQKHWHIDYLRERVTPLEVWVSYEATRLEHEWAKILLDCPEMTPFQGFGCSDCSCFSHLFFTSDMPNSCRLGAVGNIQFRTIKIEKTIWS